MARTFIDLGLPSGTLWATENEPGYHQYDEAVKTFGEMLPSKEAWKELFDQCDREWDSDRQGYVLTGPNGNTLFLPAAGWKDYDVKTGEPIPENLGGIHNAAEYGYYWSSTLYGEKRAMSVFFDIFYVNPKNDKGRLFSFSVRLCKPAGAQ